MAFTKIAKIFFLFRHICCHIWANSKAVNHKIRRKFSGQSGKVGISYSFWVSIHGIPASSSRMLLIVIFREQQRHFFA
ncbi:hypothetical protein ACCS64_37705, partial [Rhizobium ruizarguesonis]